MPIYNYNCPTHGEFEAIRSISDRKQTLCPECGETSNQRISAPAGINGGFYDQKLRVNRTKHTVR